MDYANFRNKTLDQGFNIVNKMVYVKKKHWLIMRNKRAHMKGIILCKLNKFNMKDVIFD